jgi:hypothetical protein
VEGVLDTLPAASGLTPPGCFAAPWTLSDPVADARQPFGSRYASRTDLGPNDIVSPLAAPRAQIKVADLLP